MMVLLTAEIFRCQFPSINVMVTVYQPFTVLVVNFKWKLEPFAHSCESLTQSSGDSFVLVLFGFSLIPHLN